MRSQVGYQRGLGLLSGLLLLLLIGTVVLIGFRVAPIYIEYYQIRKALATIGDDVRSYDVDTRDIQRRLDRHFAIDYISKVKASDIPIRKQQGRILADLNYEDRRALFANLHVVAQFNESIQLYP